MRSEANLENEEKIIDEIAKQLKELHEFPLNKDENYYRILENLERLRKGK